MSIYENTRMGITEGTIPLVGYPDTNPTDWQYLDIITHPPRVQPKIVVTPKSKIAGMVAWVEDIVLSNGAPAQGGPPIRWRFKISYSGGAGTGDGTEGDNIGYVATSTWD